MTARAKRTKPEPGEELIGTITPHGIRLTRAAWRAQLAYRERERAQTPPRSGFMSRLLEGRSRAGASRSEPRPSAHRSLEWRISWRSDAPFRIHFALVRWTVSAVPAVPAPGVPAVPAPIPVTPPATDGAGQPERSARPPRRESTARREAAPKRARRTERPAVGPGERQPPRLEPGRGSRARSRPR